MNQGILEREGLTRADVVELIRKWGDVNTDGLLESGCQFFSIDQIEGFIGYKLESGNAVVFGDPVCADEEKGLLAEAFDGFCLKKGLGVVYTMVSESFAGWATENLKAIAIEFGTKFVLDPSDNPAQRKGSKAVLVRKKVKHAISDGTSVIEYNGENPELERQIEDVATEWLTKRKGPQVYLCHVTLFNDRLGKRWFYAVQNGRVVGLLVLNELKAQGGWLLNNIMMTKDSPKGVSELLVISTLETLNKEGCRLVLAGPIPLAHLGKISGIGEIGSAVLRLLFKSAHLIFNLDGHRAFWDKFQPTSEGSYLLFPHKNLTFSSVKALMQAFNAGKK